MIEKIMYAVINIKTRKPVFESFNEAEVDEYLSTVPNRTGFIKAMRSRMVPCNK